MISRRCQLSCRTLDEQANIETPELCWFWPAEPIQETNVDKEDDDKPKTTETPEEAAEDTEEEYSNAEKLEMLTSYLRTSYHFCFWCGVNYQSLQDLEENCPGLTKDDH